MKRLIIPAILSLLTLGSLVHKTPVNAKVDSYQENDVFTQLTTVDPETTPQPELISEEETNIFKLNLLR
jgi:hypothetical protein